MNLRAKIDEKYISAFKLNKTEEVNTLRLVRNAIKNKDIDSRSTINTEPINDTQILSVLQNMVKQRRDSIESFKVASRNDLIEKEKKEIEIINQFLHPDQYSNNRPYLQRGLADSELWIIPTYNPEGLRVVHGYFEDGNEIQDVTYRKNKRDTNNNNIFDYENGIGGDTDGVDLNRNYDFNWIFGDGL